MTFFESIKICFSKYADFKGRASRSEYWWFFLFGFLVALMARAINETLWILFSIGMFLPNIAVGARRLHDTNRSGWWQLLELIPLLGLIVLIVFWAKDSQAGENRYGPQPDNRVM